VGINDFVEFAYFGCTGLKAARLMLSPKANDTSTEDAIFRHDLG